jgi:deoxyadenosine/deoxycytidine kinase
MLLLSIGGNDDDDDDDWAPPQLVDNPATIDDSYCSSSTASPRRTDDSTSMHGSDWEIDSDGDSALVLEDIYLRAANLYAYEEDFQDPPEDADAMFGLGHPIELPSAPSAAWKINASLTAEQQHQILQVIERGRGAFIMCPEDMGVTHVTNFSINTGTAAPIQQKCYRVNPAEEALMRKEVEALEAAGIVEKANSPWSSPAILVAKKGDINAKNSNKPAPGKAAAERKLRLCIDLRALNKVTRKDTYPVPRVDVILDGMGSGRYFTKLDLKSAYYQVALADEDSMDKTAFVTPFGSYRFKVMPMGLVNAPSAFARLGDTIFQGLIGKCMYIYIDDIIVWGDTFEAMCDNVDQVLQILAAANLKVAPDKCEFGMESMPILGHVVSSAGVAPDPDKLAVMVGYPRPRTTRQVRSFLGLTGFYRRFIRHYAEIAAPLSSITGKTVSFVWGEAQEAAFQALKKALISPPILRPPDYSRPFILYTDWSKKAVGAILAQKDQDGAEYVVAYASHKLDKAQQNYAPTEGECLAVKWAVKKFHYYISQTHFTVVTDHYSLKWLLETKDHTGKLARWAVWLQKYDFEIQHRKGTEHGNVDALTRMYDDAEGADMSGEESDTESDAPSIISEGTFESPLSINLYTQPDLFEQYISLTSQDSSVVDSVAESVAEQYVRQRPPMLVPQAPPPGPITYLAPQEWLSFANPVAPRARPTGLWIGVEGNIGAGKTTAVATLQEYAEKQYGFTVRQEDVTLFKDYLRDFYSVLQDTSSTAQAKSLAAVALQLRVLHVSSAPLRRPCLTDRTPWATQVFAAVQVQTGVMTPAHYALVTDHYARLNLPTGAASIAGRPDVLVYIHTPAVMCMQRAGLRGRAEEAELALSYFQAVEAAYIAAIRQLPPDTIVVAIDGTQPKGMVVSALKTVVDAIGQRARGVAVPALPHPHAHWCVSAPSLRTFDPEAICAAGRVLAQHLPSAPAQVQICGDSSEDDMPMFTMVGANTSQGLADGSRATSPLEHRESMPAGPQRATAPGRRGRGRLAGRGRTTLSNSMLTANPMPVSPDMPCEVCRSPDQPERMLVCDGCNEGFHMSCLSPKVLHVPAGDWFCPHCEMLGVRLLGRPGAVLGPPRQPTCLPSGRPRLPSMSQAGDRALQTTTKHNQLAGTSPVLDLSVGQGQENQLMLTSLSPAVQGASATPATAAAPTATAAPSTAPSAVYMAPLTIPAVPAPSHLPPVLLMKAPSLDSLPSLDGQEGHEEGTLLSGAGQALEDTHLGKRPVSPSAAARAPRTVKRRAPPPFSLLERVHPLLRDNSGEQPAKVGDSGKQAKVGEAELPSKVGEGRQVQQDKSRHSSLGPSSVATLGADPGASDSDGNETTVQTHPGRSADVWEDNNTLCLLRGEALPPDTPEAEVKRARRRGNTYYFEGGVLYRTRSLRHHQPRQVPAPALRQGILRDLHDNQGHMGQGKVYSLLAERFYWSGMSSDVKQYIASCTACRSRKLEFKQPQELHPIPPSRAFTRWHVDCMGPYPVSKAGNSYAIVIICPLTNWPEVEPLPDKSSSNTAGALLRCVARHGCPEVVVTDQGREFEGEFSDLLASLHVEHRKSSAYHPQGNGRAERTVKTVVTCLRKALAEPGVQVDNWDSHLSEILLAIRASRHSTTGYSPALLTYGRELLLPAQLAARAAASKEGGGAASVEVVDLCGSDSDQERLDQAVQHHLDRTLANLDEATPVALTNIATAQQKQVAAYAARRGPKAVATQLLPVGSYVVIKVKPANKLAPDWEGPYRLHAYDERGVTAIVEDATGQRWTRHVSLVAEWPGPLTA